VLVFAPGTTPYFPQMEAGTPYTINRKSGAWTGHGFNDQKDHRSVNTGTRYPKSVLPVANPRIKGGHPTQKPVALFEYLIRTYTSPGDLVLDNVMGSGTTAAAAASTGRRWVGMELDMTFAAQANKRGRTAGTQTAT
jgi:site-specific DNA-methyltransferase (adenine-specific)